MPVGYLHAGRRHSGHAFASVPPGRTEMLSSSGGRAVETMNSKKPISRPPSAEASGSALPCRQNDLRLRFIHRLTVRVIEEFLEPRCQLGLVGARHQDSSTNSTSIISRKCIRSLSRNAVSFIRTSASNRRMRWC